MKTFGTTLIAEGKKISFQENGSPFILYVEIDFLLYCIKYVLPITRIYVYKYTIGCILPFFSFFFAFTWNKISDVIGLNRLYVGLHLDQQSSEPVHLKNDKIKIILLNSFC